jgi:hypothetical protein
MLTLLRIANVALLISIVGCIAGALAGLIVFVPFLAGAWVVNAIALAGYEQHARPGWIERLHASVDHPAIRAEVVPIPVPTAEQDVRKSA